MSDKGVVYIKYPACTAAFVDTRRRIFPTLAETYSIKTGEALTREDYLRLERGEL